MRASFSASIALGLNAFMALISLFPIMLAASPFDSPSLPDSPEPIIPSKNDFTQYRPPLRCYDPSHDHGVESISPDSDSPNPQVIAFMLARIRVEPEERMHRYRRYTPGRQDPHSGDNRRIAQQFALRNCRLQLWKFSNPNAGRVDGVTNPSWDDWISYYEIVEEAARMKLFCAMNSYHYGGETAVGHGKGYGVRLFCGTMDRAANLAHIGSGGNGTAMKRSLT